MTEIQTCKKCDRYVSTLNQRLSERSEYSEKAARSGDKASQSRSSSIILVALIGSSRETQTSLTHTVSSWPPPPFVSLATPCDSPTPMTTVFDIHTELRQFIFTFLDVHSCMLVLQTSNGFFGQDVLHQALEYMSIRVEMRTSLSYLSRYYWWFPGLWRTARPFLKLASLVEHPSTFMTAMFSSLRLEPDEATVVNLSLHPVPEGNNFLSSVLDMNVRSLGLSAAICTLRFCHLDVFWFLARPRPVLVVFFKRSGLFGCFWAQAWRTWRAGIWTVTDAESTDYSSD